MTIKWDRVNCQHRNGHISGYKVLYYPTANPSERAAKKVFGTGDHQRMFSISGLPPFTSYTFQVSALSHHLDSDWLGPPVNITASTTAPHSTNYLLLVEHQYYLYNTGVTIRDYTFFSRNWLSLKWSAVQK